MSYENLMAKLASNEITFGPQLRDVMQRVRETGLHKVAAQMHGVPTFDIKTAASVLGFQLLQTHLKHVKIAAGLRAYDALVEVGEVPLALAR